LSVECWVLGVGCSPAPPPATQFRPPAVPTHPPTSPPRPCHRRSMNPRPPFPPRAGVLLAPPRLPPQCTGSAPRKCRAPCSLLPPPSSSHRSCPSWFWRVWEHPLSPLPASLPCPRRSRTPPRFSCSLSSVYRPSSLLLADAASPLEMRRLDHGENSFVQGAGGKTHRAQIPSILLHRAQIPSSLLHSLIRRRLASVWSSPCAPTHPPGTAIPRAVRSGPEIPPVHPAGAARGRGERLRRPSTTAQHSSGGRRAAASSIR